MFTKEFNNFLEGFLETLNSVGSVWQSILSNFSHNGAEHLCHYETQEKDPLFREWIQKVKIPEKEILQVLLENTGRMGGDLRTGGSGQYAVYQTSGRLVWGWECHYSTLKPGEKYLFFVRHPHADPAPEESTLRSDLTSLGWEEGRSLREAPLPDL